MILVLIQIVGLVNNILGREVVKLRSMRLAKREIHDLDQIEAILRKCDVIRIGAVDEEGLFIVPVNYGYEYEKEKGNLKFYIHSAKAGRKADAFAKSPQVAFEMDCNHEIIEGDYACSYSYAYQSLMGKGSIKKLENPEEKTYGLTKIMEHLKPGISMEFLSEMIERTDVYCLEVESFTGKMRSKQ